jgi:hypothetical protein
MTVNAKEEVPTTIHTDPNPVGNFEFGYNKVCCYYPFTYKPCSSGARHVPKLARALDVIRVHLDSARPIILSHRNTWKSTFHIYDEAETALLREWQPRVNQDLVSYGYQVDVHTTIHRGTDRQREQIIVINVRRILPANHVSLAPERHIGELPTRQKTTEERIRDIQNAIKEKY